MQAVTYFILPGFCLLLFFFFFSCSQDTLFWFPMQERLILHYPCLSLYFICSSLRFSSAALGTVAISALYIWNGLRCFLQLLANTELRWWGWIKDRREGKQTRKLWSLRFTTIPTAFWSICLLLRGALSSSRLNLFLYINLQFRSHF